MGWLGALVTGGASLIGDLFGAGQTNKATQQSVAGQQKAAGVIQGQQGTNTNLAAAQSGLYQPYSDLGATGLSQLQAGFAPGGQFTQKLTPQQILEQDPGYGFQLEQGQQAIQRAAAAQGTGISGGELKDLTTYSQNLASNAYQQAFENYNQTQNQNFQRLLGLTGIGFQGAQGQVQASQNAEGLNTGLAGTLGNIYSGIGATQAAGTIGAASQINNGISAVGNAIGNGLAAQQINNGGGGFGTGLPNPFGGGGIAPNLSNPTGIGLGSSGGILGTGSYPVAPPAGNDFIGLGGAPANGAPTSASTPFGF